jgi:hypothetical protein
MYDIQTYCSVLTDCILLLLLYCILLHVTGMQEAYNLLWGDRNFAAQIKGTYGCSRMTDADLISIVGYVAVVMAGGGTKKGCNWYPGRPDSYGYDDTSKLV